MNSISSLRDADTCWLLAFGKMIAGHGLPAAEPFSYTYYFMTQTGTANPFIMHQWLAELLLFQTYSLLGLAGLGYLVAVITSLTMTVLPSLSQRAEKVSIPACLIIGSLGQLACTFRSFARPEIYSYLLFAAVLYLINRMCGYSHKTSKEPGQQWLNVAAYAFISTVWCNIHTSFVLAIVASTVPLLATALAQYFNKKENVDRSDYKKSIIPLLALPVVSTLATLINPAGFKLWTYLPHLYFMKVGVDEARNINMADLQSRGLLPFLILFGLYMLTLILRLKKSVDNLDRRFFLHLILGLGALALVFSKIRLLVYIVIIATWEWPLLLGYLINHKSEIGARAFKPWHLMALAMAPLASLLGAIYVAACVYPPKMPQDMPGFIAPFHAIDYINKHHINGPVLNEARFGDMMIWYLNPPIPVFIDTRLDLYGDQFCQQYLDLTSCADGWQEGLANLDINWVFLPPTKPLVRALSQDPHWEVVFSDKSAVIIVKKATTK